MYPKVLFSCLALCLAMAGTCQSRVYELYQQAHADYDSGNYLEYLNKLVEANRIRRNHPTLLFALSEAYATNDQPDSAFYYLEKSLQIHASLPYESSEKWKSLKNHPAFNQIQNKNTLRLQRVQHSTVSAEFDRPELHIEDVAMHRASGRMFVGSLRTGEVWQKKDDQDWEKFTQETDGWAILALAVDTLRHCVWATSSVMPQQLAFDSTQRHHGAIQAFDLETGKVVVRRVTRGKGIVLGDLTIQKDGSILLSNSSFEDPGVFLFDPKTLEITPFGFLPELASPQGLAIDHRNSLIYLADYRFGILQINTNEMSARWLSNDTDHSTKGIDGLFAYKDYLIAIHNGLTPKQVTAYKVEGSTLVKAISLDKALEDFDEPTAGTLIQNELHYVSNSPWSAYSKKGSFPSRILAPTCIRRLRLDQLLE